ncbi:MAG: GNAT family N-acetyltransferase [Anaerolineae bacterium]|nr:GNAT family N-acetyltransferase [Anaerolineae bacterium]
MTSIKPVVVVRQLADTDHAWRDDLLDREWGGPLMVSRGVLYDLRTLPGLIAWHGKRRVGLATYHIDGDACEVRSLNSLTERIGAGTALLRAVEEIARAAGCVRVWLITTNDNLHALGFYQRRGYVLAALYPDAIAEARKLKPQIPLIGMSHIPLRDEIELEKRL